MKSLYIRDLSVYSSRIRVLDKRAKNIYAVNNSRVKEQSDLNQDKGKQQPSLPYVVCHICTIYEEYNKTSEFILVFGRADLKRGF